MAPRGRCSTHPGVLRVRGHAGAREAAKGKAVGEGNRRFWCDGGREGWGLMAFDKGGGGRTPPRSSNLGCACVFSLSLSLSQSPFLSHLLFLSSLSGLSWGWDGVGYGRRGEGGGGEAAEGAHRGLKGLSMGFAFVYVVMQVALHDWKILRCSSSRVGIFRRGQSLPVARVGGLGGGRGGCAWRE